MVLSRKLPSSLYRSREGNRLTCLKPPGALFIHVLLVMPLELKLNWMTFGERRFNIKSITVRIVGASQIILLKPNDRTKENYGP